MPPYARPAALAALGLASPALAQMTFVDLAPSAGVESVSLGRGAAMVDLDGDGRLDLATADDESAIRLFRQVDGVGELPAFDDGAVAWSAPQVVRNSFVILVADFDNDGDDDIFRGNGGRFPEEPNELYRNDIDQLTHLGAFVDVSDSAGDVTGIGATHGGALLDFDRDGELDIFVGNSSFAPSQLLRNVGGLAFEDVAASSGLGAIEVSRHVGAADFDLDGWPDIAQANYSHAVGNRLWHNQQDGTFLDVAPAMGVDEVGENNFGMVLADFDQDGWVDIFLPKLEQSELIAPLLVFRNLGGTDFEAPVELGVVGAMGHTAGDLDSDGFPELWSGTGNPASAHPDELLRNLSSGPGSIEFEDISAASGIAGAEPTRSHGAAFGDLDEDGDTDAYINNGGPVFGFEEANYLWANQGNGNHWLDVELEGVLSNRSAVGARLEAITASGRSVFIDRQVGIGFGNTHSPRLRFGLADEDGVERVEIRWPSGIRQTWLSPATDTLHDLLETGVVVANTPTAGAGLEVAAAGPAGWVVELYVGLGPLVPALPLPQFGGELGLVPPLVLIGAATLDGEGRADINVPIPSGLAGQTLFAQGWLRPIDDFFGGVFTPTLTLAIE
ncbi:MAG: CRTAC1 family protein [Planctomycetota bacterium]